MFEISRKAFNVSMDATNLSKHNIYVLIVYVLLNQHDYITCQAPEGVYNPDIYLSTGGLIRRHGYVSEAHTVLTRDGYFLQIFRMPFGKNEPFKRTLRKPVVLVQHGLVGCSDEWLVLGPNQSIAFMMADAGYDVWLGNFRGNRHGLDHITLTPDMPIFWEFSNDDHAFYDTPAIIDHILKSTGHSSLTHVSHSLGSSTAIALLAEYPEYNRKINLMISMAPAVYVSHTVSPIRLIYDRPDLLKFISDTLVKFHPIEILQRTQYKEIRFCDFKLDSEKICFDLQGIFVGLDHKESNASMIPVITSHFPAAAGSHVFLQFAQQMHSARFSKFDYGEEENLKIYNSSKPPLLEVENVHVPAAVFYAENDYLINTVDAEKAISQLPNVIKQYLVPDKNFSHLDFLFGIYTPKLVYSEILTLLKENLVTPSEPRENKKMAPPLEIKRLGILPRIIQFSLLIVFLIYLKVQLYNITRVINFSLGESQLKQQETINFNYQFTENNYNPIHI